MRLDYPFYVAAAVFLIATATFLIDMTMQKTLWVVGTTVVGIAAIGVGYLQRPRAMAKTISPAISITPTSTPVSLTFTVTTTIQTAPAPVETIEKPVAAPVVEHKPDIQTAILTSALPLIPLTSVKGIGEKRAAQLNSIGIYSIKELASSSSDKISKALKVSPKIVDKWISGAKAKQNN